ncbi:MAG: tetratricopeptide repeat protein [Firmicutes bacterium]|nr:tetratricopeptide repeat protein [Bacillota bacterium]
MKKVFLTVLLSVLLFSFNSSAFAAFVDDKINELVTKGDALVLEKKYSEALEEYKKASEMNREKAVPHYKMGVAYYFLNQMDKAEASYKEAIKLDPGYAKAMNNLALVYEKLGRVQEALPLYKKALEVKPDYTFAMFNQAALLIKLERLDEAEKCANKLNVTAPRDSGAFYLLGLIYEYREQFQKSEEYYLKSLALSADNPDAAKGIKRVKTHLDRLTAVRTGLENARTIVSFKLLPDYDFAGISETVIGARIINIKYNDEQDIFLVKFKGPGVLGGKSLKELLEEPDNSLKTFLKDMKFSAFEFGASADFSSGRAISDESSKGPEKYNKSTRYYNFKCLQNGKDVDGIMMVFRTAADSEPILLISTAPTGKFSVPAAEAFYRHIEPPVSNNSATK